MKKMQFLILLLIALNANSAFSGGADDPVYQTFSGRVYGYNTTLSVGESNGQGTDEKNITNNVKQRMNLISLNIIGPTQYLSLSYSNFIKRNFIPEVGIGLKFMGFYGGVKYHHWFRFNESFLSPYIGMIYSHSKYFTIENSMEFSMPIYNGPVNQLHIPLGLLFWGQEGFNLALEVSKVYYLNKINAEKYLRVIPCLKIGYSF